MSLQRIFGSARFAACWLFSIALVTASTADAGLNSSPAWVYEPNHDGALIGRAVSTAGDVNGDGYSDVLVGGPGWSNGQIGEGRAFLFLGGGSGLSSAPNWTFENNHVNGRLGEGIACAGDVNGDGYDDVLVGAPGYTNGQTAEGRAYCFHGGPSGLSTTANWTREGGVAGAQFGSNLCPAGDVNGDGYDDVLVASPYFGVSQPSEGSAYLYLGGPTGLSTSTAWSKEGDLTGAHFGYSLSTAGDVNGDGYDDVIIGAPDYDTVDDTGAAWIYLGTSTGLSNTAVWFVDGGTSWHFGLTVATIGDSNGDGYSDVMVSASIGGNPTYVYAYYGAASGPDTGVDQIYTRTGNSAFGLGMFSAGDVNGDGYADAVIGDSGADSGDLGNGREGAIFLFESLGSYGLSPQPTDVIYGPEVTSGLYGRQAEAAGDVNGDGFGDVIVGDMYFDDGTDFEGKVWVHLGAPSRESGNADWIDTVNQAHANLGNALAMGDFDGDGFSDLAVGAEAQDNGQAEEGAAFVYMGHRDGLPSTAEWAADSDQSAAFFGHSIANAGDVNADGYEDLLVGASHWDHGEINEGGVWCYHGSTSGPVASYSQRLEIDQANALFGWSVASAGDVNGDGYTDVAVGAPFYKADGFSSSGGVFVYCGSATGLPSTPTWTYGYAFAGSSFGYSVSCAGDVNGDGYSDLIVGAINAESGQASEGLAFVFHGGAGGLANSPNTTLQANQSGADFGFDVSSAGDVNGDGYSDVMVGAPTYDNGANAEGLARVYLGSATGVSTVAAWSTEGGQSSALWGHSVSSAGDVDNDGYGDVIVGASFYSHAVSDEGRAQVFFGGPSGLSLTSTWFADGGQSGSHFGGEVAGGGDINGDGFSDVSIGAPEFTDTQTSQGKVTLFYGNEKGIDRPVHQVTADGLDTISLLGLSDDPNSIRLTGLARSAFGRSDVRAQWQILSFGSFLTDGLYSDATEHDTGTPIVGLGSRRWVTPPSIGGLSADTPYHWQLRFRGDSPYFPWTPWIKLPGNVATETDFRTAPAVSDAAGPIELDTSRALRFAQVGPNPCRDATTLNFVVPSQAPVRLSIHDVSGRRVVTLIDDELHAGTHSARWEMRDQREREVAPGVYFARLEAGGVVRERRIVRVR